MTILGGSTNRSASPAPSDLVSADDVQAPLHAVSMQDALQQLSDEAASPQAALSSLVGQRLDRLPQPGQGSTLERWRMLSTVAKHDLSLAKLYEGHTDALSIMEELGAPYTPTAGVAGTWGTWASEAPDGRVLIESIELDGTARLTGTKRWCSGAEHVDHGLLTAWFADGRGPQLVAVDMTQSGVAVHSGAWRAVGMAASASVDVELTNASGRLVGQVGGYLERPGFWQGGAGIAACWFGGALALADVLNASLVAASGAGSKPNSPFKTAALGHVDVALRSAAALLRESARWIDEHPRDDASVVASRARLLVEQTCISVLDECGRALGATPFCRDERFARHAADLPVFIRQSHGEQDYAALGASAVAAQESSWTL